MKISIAPARRAHERARLDGRPFAGVWVTAVIAGCVMQPSLPSNAPKSALTSGDASHATPSPFHLKPEWDGPCARRERHEGVDVNLGHTPEAFVRAAHC